MIISHPAHNEYQRKPLTQHLTNVAMGAKDRIQRLSLATQLIDKDILADLSFRIGLLHDLGKASAYFQEYIRGGRSSAYTNHSLISAIVLYYDLCGDSRLRDFAHIGFKAVQRHHGNLSTFGTEKLSNGILAYTTLEIYVNIREQITRDKDLQDFISRHSILLTELDKGQLRELGNNLEDLNECDSQDDAIERYLIQNLLFSVLIDADKYDAARLDYQPDQALNIGAVYNPQPYLDGMKIDDNELNRIRRKLLEEAKTVETQDSQRRCFSMSAPTGSGKTLACMGFTDTLQNSLTRRRRTIYCLPYTSIIDQNHEVIASVFRDNGLDAGNTELLLKHHHLVDYSRQNSDDKYDYQDYLNDHLLADSWSAACVVSTFVQLFHSLIGSRNSMVRKLHNIVNSIILLDEVQSLPPKYYPLMRKIFSVLANRFDTYILTCTATQPFIYEPSSYSEISPKHLFEHNVFNRVKLYIHEEVVSLDDFVQNLDLRGVKKALFVMNTKKSALDLYKMLKDNYQDVYEVYCLTTLHTPRCRLKQIDVIKNALAENRGVIVVSTQLIEAGVDLSFCRVYRDMGPLDSIIQVAGRCNRHGELGILGGEMHLLRLYKDGKEYSASIYDNYLLTKTIGMLRGREHLESKDFPALIREYYLSLDFGAEANAILRALGELNYDLDIDGQISIDSFRLIVDNYATNSIYILLDAEAQSAMDDLIASRSMLRHNKQLSSDQESQAHLRIEKSYHALANYQLNLTDSERKHYSTKMSFFHELDKDNHIYYIPYSDWDKAYSKETGFILNPFEKGSALAL